MYRYIQVNVQAWRLNMAEFHSAVTHKTEKDWENNEK